MRREFIAVSVLAASAALATAVLSAWLGLSARAVKDSSRPFDAGAEGMSAWIAPASGEAPIDTTGRVTAFARTPEAWRVELQATSGRIELEIALPPRIPLPFALGDTVRVRVERAGGWHRLFDAGIWASDGGTLMAVHLGGENPPEVRELKVTRGGAVEEKRFQSDYGEQRVIQHAVVFTAPDATASTAGGKWRRLETRGRAFYVWGSSEEQHVNGPAIPDSVPNTFDWAIVRAAPARSQQTQ